MRPRRIALAVVLVLSVPAAGFAGPPPKDASGRAAQPAADRVVRLEVGREKVLTAPGVARVAVGDPEVADVHVVGDREILITGVGAGTTSLIVWFQGGHRKTWQVVVTEAGRLEEAKSAVKALGLETKLLLRKAGNKVVVQGTIGTPEALSKLQMLKKTLPGLVLMVRVDPAIYQEIARRIDAALAEEGLPNAHARVVGTTIFLEGVVTDEAERKKAAEIAHAIYGAVGVGRLEAR